MDRTQIYLDQELKGSLREIAEREGRSLAAVVRDAAAEYVARRRDAGPADPLLDLVGIGEGRTTDGALNHDHYLYGAPKERG